MAYFRDANRIFIGHHPSRVIGRRQTISDAYAESTPHLRMEAIPDQPDSDTGQPFQNMRRRNVMITVTGLPPVTTEYDGAVPFEEYQTHLPTTRNKQFRAYAAIGHREACSTKTGQFGLMTIHGMTNGFAEVFGKEPVANLWWQNRHPAPQPNGGYIGAHEIFLDSQTYSIINWMWAHFDDQLQMYQASLDQAKAALTDEAARANGGAVAEAIFGRGLDTRFRNAIHHSRYQTFGTAATQAIRAQIIQEYTGPQMFGCDTLPPPSQQNQNSAYYLGPLEKLNRDVSSWIHTVDLEIDLFLYQNQHLLKQRYGERCTELWVAALTSTYASLNFSTTVPWISMSIHAYLGVPHCCDSTIVC